MQKRLKVGEWNFNEDEEDYTIRLDEESFYSSKNQDTIIILSEIIKSRGRSGVKDKERIEELYEEAQEASKRFDNTMNSLRGR